MRGPLPSSLGATNNPGTFFSVGDLCEAVEVLYSCSFFSYIFGGLEVATQANLTPGMKYGVMVNAGRLYWDLIGFHTIFDPKNNNYT